MISRLVVIDKEENVQKVQKYSCETTESVCTQKKQLKSHRVTASNKTDMSLVHEHHCCVQMCVCVRL